MHAIMIAAIIALSPPAAFAQDREPCIAAVKRGGSPYKYPDTCMTQSTSTQLITIDVRVTKERAADELFVVEVPMRAIRSAGAVVQLFYSGVAGKSQWFVMSSMRGVVLMPNSVMLPLRKWVEHGFPVGSFVRVVVMSAP